MEQEISIIQLILNASIIVQIVIGILVVFSILSWGIIFSKWISLTRVKHNTKSFLRQYQNTNNVSTLYTALTGKEHHRSVEALFYNGINEYNKLNKQGTTDATVIMLNIERTLASSVEAEIDHYESSLATLATFGSVSPYIGLLGTVWGIMHAFIGLGNMGQATLSTVAPGIAEALVATAIGLFVAIPAYIFYNKFSSEVSSLNNKMNKFGDDFLNLISSRLANQSNQSNQDNL
ncbi:MAG: protein TolQ [Proteobacteria bacterium]|jgi:biopolymer transport protein TolQ|nr:protein TolQ [Pseudomonadota bacterium]